MYFWDPTFVLIIPAMLFAMWAQMKVRSAYAKYSQVGVRSGLTGAKVAELILRDANVPITDRPETQPGGVGCGIAAIGGQMTDHYDPRTHMLRLSQEVYSGRSVAALGIAAHEAGHAVQHAQMYGPLALRTMIYPITGIGSQLAWPLFIIGFLMRSTLMIQIGIMLFVGAVAFTLVTLPVEFNASRRALKALSGSGYLDAEELDGARAVLSAAALTYVAAAAMAFLQLLRMLMLARRR